MWASFGLLALGLAQCAAFTGRPIHSRQTVLLAATLEPKKARPSRVKRLEDSVARLEAGESEADIMRNIGQRQAKEDRELGASAPSTPTAARKKRNVNP